jgi:tripartite-type tricarboxylate transporter receptor subunit TctC
VGELIAHAKAAPGRLAYGSSGLGSVNHLGTALLAARASIDLVHVPYKGNALALPDLLAGRIQLLFANGVGASPHLKSGKAKAIAISGSRRSAAFPDVPTVAESGLPGYELTNAYFMYVPGGTPRDLRELLRREFEEAVHAPEVRAKLAPSGMDPGERLSLASLRTLYEREFATWSAFVKSSGLKLAE